MILCSLQIRSQLLHSFPSYCLFCYRLYIANVFLSFIICQLCYLSNIFSTNFPAFTLCFVKILHPHCLYKPMHLSCNQCHILAGNSLVVKAEICFTHVVQECCMVCLHTEQKSTLTVCLLRERFIFHSSSLRHSHQKHVALLH